MSLRKYAVALALSLVLAGAGCAADPAPTTDDGIDAARATTECQLLAGLMTADTELTPETAEEMVEILDGISKNGYPESAAVAEMIVSSYLNEETDPAEADAAVEEWAGFCTRNATA